MEPVQFNVGDTFDTFTAFKERLQQYEKTNFINTSIGKSRTIESKKRELKKDRYFNEDLVYYSLIVNCYKSGSHRAGRNNGKRTNTFTSKTFCQFFIKVTATPCGMKLLVNEVNLQHNHEVCQEFYNMHPKQRRLDDTEKKVIQTMHKVKSNKKIIKQHVEGLSGKFLKMKDIHNCITTFKKDSKLTLLLRI